MLKFTNMSPREQKKYFTSLTSKEKLGISIPIVHNFINNVKFTQEITESTYNVIRAAEYILDRYSKGKQSYNNLVSSYNVVMTLINNNYRLFRVFKII